MITPMGAASARARFTALLEEARSSKEYVRDALALLETTASNDSRLTLLGELLAEDIGVEEVQKVLWVNPELNLTADERITRMWPVAAVPALRDSVASLHEHLFKDDYEKVTSSWIRLSDVMDWGWRELRPKPVVFVLVLPAAAAAVEKVRSWPWYATGEMALIHPEPNTESPPGQDYVLSHYGLDEPANVQLCARDAGCQLGPFVSWLSGFHRIDGQFLYVGFQHRALKDTRVWAAFTPNVEQGVVNAVRKLPHELNHDFGELILHTQASRLEGFWKRTEPLELHETKGKADALASLRWLLHLESGGVWPRSLNDDGANEAMKGLCGKGSCVVLGERGRPLGPLGAVLLLMAAVASKCGGSVLSSLPLTLDGELDALARNKVLPPQSQALARKSTTALFRMLQDIAIHDNRPVVEQAHVCPKGLEVVLDRNPLARPGGRSANLPEALRSGLQGLASAGTGESNWGLTARRIVDFWVDMHTTSGSINDECRFLPPGGHLELEAAGRKLVLRMRCYESGRFLR